ncbi:lysoplasmalogenase family protein [Streptomyces tendae]|uniref:lysoplasmalogenase family protein n=1 Tax=Streptomyces tendae TaxID=1932 RepID=UPI0037214C63
MPWPVALLAVLGAGNLLALTLDLPVLEWLTKPLLAPLLAAHLWRATGTRHRLVLAGLGLATAGDTALLMDGPAAFVAGLACFLGTQICYIVAFVAAGARDHLRARPKVLTGYLGAWLVANVALAPSLTAPMIPLIALYSLALVLMAATARVLGARPACGGAVFVVSDLLVGLGAAGVDFAGRPVAVMLTYVVAQFLLVDAFVRPSRGAGEDRPHGSRAPA